MIDLKITSDRLKNHLHYSKWLYVLALVVVLVAFNLVYGMTAPQVPTEYKVSIMVNDYTLSEGGLKTLETDILSLLPEDQQEVNLYSMPVGGEGQEYQILQVIMARMVAKQDDILILHQDMFENFARQGSFIPLEGEVTLPDQPEEVDMSNYTLEVVDDEGNGDGQPKLYGVPLDGSAGLQNYGIINKGLVACIPVTSGNMENAIKSLQIMLDKTEFVEVE